jgi:hypothetical protein
MTPDQIAIEKITGRPWREVLDEMLARPWNPVVGELRIVEDTWAARLRRKLRAHRPQLAAA